MRIVGLKLFRDGDQLSRYLHPRLNPPLRLLLGNGSSYWVPKKIDANNKNLNTPKIDSNLWSPGCLSLEPPRISPSAGENALVRLAQSCSERLDREAATGRRPRCPGGVDADPRVIPSGCQRWSNKPQTAVELGRYHLKV